MPNPLKSAHCFEGNSTQFAPLRNSEEIDALMERLNEEREQRYQEWLAAEPSPVIKRLRAIRDSRTREQVNRE